MLFTLVIGLLSAGYFFLRRLIIRLRFVLSGGAGEAAGERVPYAIFSDDKRYWNVFKPICDEFESRGVEAHYLTASPDDPALQEKYEHVKCECIGPGNKVFAHLNVMSADICLATTPGLQVYQWKRSSDVSYYVHILHATSTAAWYRMFGLDFFDAVLLSNEYQIGEIRELEEKRGLAPKELEIVGCTYMDSMAARLAADADSATRESDAQSTTVLLAPTWGPNGLLSRYGETLIQSLVDTGFDIVVRPHPQSMSSEKELMERLRKKFPEGEHFSWNFDNDNYDILKRADIMLSDMSGVIHDFALVFDKPVMYVLGNIDTGPFDAAWLDEPFWESTLFTDTGIPIEESQFADMRATIQHVLFDPEIAARRAHAREESWFYRGEAATRTVDYLVAKREEILSRAAGETKETPSRPDTAEAQASDMQEGSKDEGR